MGSGASSTPSTKPGPRKLDTCAEAVRGHVDGDSADQRLSACFQRWDVSGSGTISMYELMRVLEGCGVKLDAKDVSSVFSSVDRNQDGVIDYEEFVAWLYPESPHRRVGSLTKTLSQDSALSSSPSWASAMPLLLRLHSAANLPESISSASASAFVSKNGSAPAAKANWVTVKDCTDPCWNITRDLGIHSLAKVADANEELILEFWDGRSMIGDVRVPLADLRRDRWHEYAVDLSIAFARKTAGRVTPSVRFMIISEPPPVKKVFLIRHGESAWNKAQREKKVTAMLEQVDHPLSDDGMQQCLKLNTKIDAAKEHRRKARLASSTDQLFQFSSSVSSGAPDLTQNESDFLDVQIVLSSPLSRAIQTALVGLHPLLKELDRLHLCRNAREKRNTGGKDTTGTAMGEAEIVHRVRDVLAKGKTLGEADVDRFLSIPLDSSEANNRWWNDSRESSSAVRERLQEFVSQMRFLKEERIAVVGHSHFFRSLLKEGLNSEATVRGAQRADFISKKLDNCGVVAVTLDFTKGAEKPITEVELILASQLCKH